MGGKLTPSKREQINSSANSMRRDDIVVAHKLDDWKVQLCLDALITLHPPPKEEKT